MMKTYIGTKKIEAEPMTRGEYAKLSGRNSILPSESESDGGYRVVYPDGYISWSPKDVFEEAYREVEKYPLSETAILMSSPDYIGRFQAEYLQLSIRRDRLASMLQNYKLGTLPFKPKCSYELLHKQLVHMNAYLDCLEERASIEGIVLKVSE